MKKLAFILLFPSLCFAQQITVEQVNQALALSRAASSQELQIKDALIAELTDKLKKAEAACVKP